ncbi:MAG: RagB/SusD family nutrient uptake outer membrane protein [Mediterranea sp.]|nr:RagB/SusD family nutrient uptake outer membrane protein [Mediterranea sp.]
MKKIKYLAISAALVSMTVTGCIEEYDPLSDTVTADQAANAPGAYQNFVNAITSSLSGQFTYSGSSVTPYDYGYPAFYLFRDVMGQDMVPIYSGSWYGTWYQCGVGLGPAYAVSQYPWTYYYGWIKSCNTVISMSGENPEGEHKTGAGIAYAMRALFYQDIARMFAAKTYTDDPSSETVPIVTESKSVADLVSNPRASNADMWAFIISDLDKAEEYLADYKRADKYTPDLSVVYGLKARAYLTMGQWADAEKYAKLAQAGYTAMDEAAYTSRETGFNTPNSSWMMGLTYKSDDPNILLNDGDSSWASSMCLEINPTTSGCGYAANYGQQIVMDRHLYETIPSTDFRRKCFVDFAIDDLPSKEEQIAALEAYSDYPDWVYTTSAENNYGRVGGLSLKFRVAGGAAGHDNQYVGFVVAVPMMRVEEMILIEAEAAGRQNEANGISLLTAFAKTRDADYTYGTHTDSYGNSSTGNFLNEIWWQRRLEFWGEGLATFDIKRLNKGIIRSYDGTNHVEGYRWNQTTVPQWMHWCIVQTETNYNTACTNNPAPVAPTGDSEPYVW